MKIVKSLLLGSAAGLVAVTGAQAADLPVKAKPVEYVKVCTLYGAGFYYIPGTDTCIKIGGFLRTEWNHNAGGSFDVLIDGGAAAMTRNTNTLVNRSRIITSFDVRSQTEYGTLRAYARAGWQWTTNDFQIGGSQCASSLTGAAGNSVSSSTVPAGWSGSSSCTYLDRAFIQFAGFTFGKTQSFFEFLGPSYSYMSQWLSIDTGGSGPAVFAYTMQFGNGLSATISAEDGTYHRAPIVAVPTFAAGAGASGLFPSGGSNPSSHRGHQIPDLVGNLRVDQAWGSAQIMGALHPLAANYYQVATGFSLVAPTTTVTVTGGAGTVVGTFVVTGGITGGANNLTSHPDTKLGWAVGGGITLKMPWDPKDTFSVAAHYCKGAVRYCTQPGGTLGTGTGAGLVNEGKIGVGWLDDAYYDSREANGGSLELSKVWSAVAAFEHYWTPTLRSSIYGGYMKFEANSSVVDTQVCAGGLPAGTGLPATGPGSLSQGPGCTDWSAYQIGSRTIWNPVANLDIGVDVMYTKINTAFQGQVRSVTTQGLPIALLVDDTHQWSGILRIQRNFWP